MHATWVPAITALITTTINVILNIILVGPFQTVGLASAIVIANMIQTILFLCILHKKYKFRIFMYQFITFVKNYSIQFTFYGSFFLIFYYIIYYCIQRYISPLYAQFFLIKIGLWFWIAPLA